MENSVANQISEKKLSRVFVRSWEREFPLMPGLIPVTVITIISFLEHTHGLVVLLCLYCLIPVGA